jgi:hypothetical protein
MSCSTTKKVSSKTSEVVPSNYHLKERQYAGFIKIGGDNYWTKFFSSKEEARLELRCLEKSLSYELIETLEEEGVYPERAIIMEQKYQESGRSNGLYTGLNVKDGQVSLDCPK